MSHLKSAATLLALLTLSANAGAQGVLDANSAAEDDIRAIDGLAATAADIVLAGRPFDSIGELDLALAAAVDDAGRTELYRRLFVPINLNTAPREEILMIPGVGDRMAHEFEEYRPYTSMEQFRREIGKYVDDDEVARLEMYVTLD